MSCDIANGVAEPCKSIVGGLEALYIINYGDYAATDLTYDVTNTDMINDINSVSNVYKFELKGTNSFEQTINSNRENGTTFVEQVLTVTLKKQDAAGDLRGGYLISLKKRPPAGRLFKNPGIWAGRG